MESEKERKWRVTREGRERRGREREKKRREKEIAYRPCCQGYSR